ncbi:unnamed protein product [Nesidiocoris tenuis]|uniref:Uncharacterized protein n=1 Tax=Nesidiocoris tenuis TaxID=355587 RepID=A0A6H5H759_9HEMI|nr:unnamed protein product [Nesidiocoris tenuis]
MFLMARNCDYSQYFRHIGIAHVGDTVLSFYPLRHPPKSKNWKYLSRPEFTPEPKRPSGRPEYECRPRPPPAFRPPSGHQRAATSCGKLKCVSGQRSLATRSFTKHALHRITDSLFHPIFWRSGPANVSYPLPYSHNEAAPSA